VTNEGTELSRVRVAIIAEYIPLRSDKRALHQRLMKVHDFRSNIATRNIFSYALPIIATKLSLAQIPSDSIHSEFVFVTLIRQRRTATVIELGHSTSRARIDTPLAFLFETAIDRSRRGQSF